jgi:DNA-binding YbaB/EbfC family protein
MMKGGLGNLMKQAQRMQQELQQAQEKLAEQEISAEAGAGLVKVTMNGRHEVRRIQIDDSLLQDDKEMLEDLVAAAINAAVQKVADNQQEQLAGLTAGLGLPAGMKLPF